MHAMTPFDLRSLQDTAKVRAIQEATRGGRSVTAILKTIMMYTLYDILFT